MRCYEIYENQTGNYICMVEATSCQEAEKVAREYLNREDIYTKVSMNWANMSRV